MISLYLEDILKRANLNPNRVKLIRHSLNDKQFKKCYEAGFLDDYQSVQKNNFTKNCDYILAFVSGSGTSAKFKGCYKAGPGQLASKTLVPVGFPSPEMFNGTDYYFDIQKISLLGDLVDRLIIDWGKSAISWCQWANNAKPVLAIQEKPKMIFAGYENVVLTYQDLKEIVEDPILYENWTTALVSVYAIYLITDTTDGKQYVGSAYGKNGLLGRWKTYVETKHGNDKGIKELICNFPERYQNFQFSILQILPKTLTDDEVIQYESLYKRKLLSREFGLNEN